MIFLNNTYILIYFSKIVNIKNECQQIEESFAIITEKKKLNTMNMGRVCSESSSIILCNSSIAVFWVSLSPSLLSELNKRWRLK